LRVEIQARKNDTQKLEIKRSASQIPASSFARLPSSLKSYDVTRRRDKKDRPIGLPAVLRKLDRDGKTFNLIAIQ
jgi:hypothetical protein